MFMPAGPRSYGGGSRSSGGSRGGGLSFSSRPHHGGHHRVGPRRPFRMHFGSRVYVVAGGALSKVVAFLIIAGIALFFTFAGWTTMKDNKQYLKQMEEDSAYYQNLVATGTVVDARIDDEYFAFEYNGYAYYQIVYKYQNSNGKTCTGQTYANYTTAQIMALGEEIEIAYDSNGFSIPTSYQLKDVEYQYVEHQYKIGIIILLVSGVALILFVGVAVMIFVKNLKREAEKHEQDVARHEQEMERAELENEALKPKCCSYCGCKIEKTDKRCPGCGAGV